MTERWRTPDSPEPTLTMEMIAARVLDMFVNTANTPFSEYMDNVMVVAKALLAVLNIHVPFTPPVGTAWISGGRKPHCEGCATGDPFLDQSWAGIEPGVASRSSCLLVSGTEPSLPTPSAVADVGVAPR